MKKYIVFIWLVFVSVKIYAQSYSCTNLFTANEVGSTLYTNYKSIGIDAEKNIYLYGVFSNSLTSSNFTLNSPNENSLYLIKKDSNNNVIWSKIIAMGISDPSLKTMILDVDEQQTIYVGINFSDSVSILNQTYYSNVDKETIFFTLNKNGDLQHVKRENSLTSFELGTKGLVYKNGSVYAVATVACDVSVTNPGPCTVNFHNNNLTIRSYDVLLIKYDTSFNVIWSRVLGGTYTEGCNLLSVDENENVYCAATTISGVIYFDSAQITMNPVYTHNTAGFVAKYSKEGVYKWAKHFGKTNIGAGGSVLNVAAYKNSVYITYSGDQNSVGGLLNQFIIEGGGNASSPNSYYSSFICRFDSNGNYKWLLMPFTSKLSLNSLTIDSDENVYATGKYIGGMNIYQDTVYSRGYDACVIVLDSAKNTKLLYTGGGDYGELPLNIIIDQERSIYVCGGSSSNPLEFDAISEPTFGNSTVFIAKLTQTPLSNTTHTSLANDVSFYPNPAQTVLHTKGTIDAQSQLKIYSLLGQLLFQTSNVNNIPVATIPNGIYYVQYQQNKQLKTQKIIINH